MNPITMRYLLLILLLTLMPAWASDAIGPKLDIGLGGKCVDDPKLMRTNHMEFLMHQRDDTMLRGIRGGKYSLTACVECHASKKNNSVLGSSENFCQGCHEYARVKIDCFECHSSKRKNIVETAL
jgi:cytochrome c553